MFENPMIRPRRGGALAASVALHVLAGAAVSLSGALAVGEPPDVETRVIVYVPDARVEPVRLVSSVPRAAAQAASSPAPAAPAPAPSMPSLPVTQPEALSPTIPEPGGGEELPGGDTEDVSPSPGIGVATTGGGSGLGFGAGPVSPTAPGVTPPAGLFTPPPVYPELARRAGIEGVVVLEAIVDAEGLVTDVRILRGANPLLDHEAVAAVSRWRYRPAFVGARAVACYLTVTVKFTIQR